MYNVFKTTENSMGQSYCQVQIKCPKSGGYTQKLLNWWHPRFWKMENVCLHLTLGVWRVIS